MILAVCLHPMIPEYVSETTAQNKSISFLLARYRKRMNSPDWLSTVEQAVRGETYESVVLWAFEFGFELKSMVLYLAALVQIAAYNNVVAVIVPEDFAEEVAEQMLWETVMYPVFDESGQFSHLEVVI